MAEPPHAVDKARLTERATLAPPVAQSTDGPAPLKVKIGNAVATAVVFRGRAVELAPFTRGNLARFELQ